jgi:hypothetical protein
MSGTLAIAFVVFFCVGTAAALCSPGCLSGISPVVRARGVVTGVRLTGVGDDRYREVEVDLMVTRPGGGQFPVRQRARVPVGTLAAVVPGAVVAACYPAGDESAVSLRLPGH